MTNETASAGIAVTDKLCEGFTKELSQGQELWEQALTWLTDKGLSFAVNVIASAVILVLGWLAIKLIVNMVGKAVEKGGKKNTLFGNFIRNVTGKICWAVLIVDLGDDALESGDNDIVANLEGLVDGDHESRGEVAEGLLEGEA